MSRAKRRNAETANSGTHTIHLLPIHPHVHPRCRYTLCYADNYDSASTSFSTIWANCNRDLLVLGCTTSGSATLVAAGTAPRASLLACNSGQATSPTCIINKINW